MDISLVLLLIASSMLTICRARYSGDDTSYEHRYHLQNGGEGYYKDGYASSTGFTNVYVSQGKNNMENDYDKQATQSLKDFYNENYKSDEETLTDDYEQEEERKQNFKVNERDRITHYKKSQSSESSDESDLSERIPTLLSREYYIDEEDDPTVLSGDSKRKPKTYWYQERYFYPDDEER